MKRKNPLAHLSTYEILMYALRADPHNPPQGHPACLKGEYIFTALPLKNAEGRIVARKRIFKKSDDSKYERIEYITHGWEVEMASSRLPMRG